MRHRSHSSRRKPRTDTGTVLLHWLAVAAVTVAGATGLAIAADAPGRDWLAAFKGWLPSGNVWRLHLIAGLLLVAVAGAYAAYIPRAGLSRRVRLDRARLHALKTRGRARWGAVNVVLYWALFVLIGVQAVSGLMLFLGHGGTAVRLHLWSGLMIIGYPVVHVLAQYAYGQMEQVLRVLRPGPLAAGPRAPSLAELVHDHLEQLEQRARERAARPPPKPSGPPTLSSHPIAVAGASGITILALIASIDVGARDRLVVAAIGKHEVPRLDGDLADPVWRRARPVTVETNQGANFGGTGASKVTVRAVHDGTTAYLAFTWDDPTRSMKHLPLVKKEGGWRLVHTRYDVEDEDAYYEDKFSVLLAESPLMPAAGSIHLGARPIADKPPGLAGRGLHYTTDGSVVDMWHWKATRGGLLGFMDDNWFGPPAEPTVAESAGRSRYKGGYQTDAGKAFYSNNFDQQPPGGYQGPIRPKRLPKDPVATLQAMGTADLDPEQSVPDGARWWLTEAESVPWSAEADSRLPVGTVIPGVVIAGAYDGDRADIKAAAKWAAGRWSLEIARRLDTGSRHDVPIRTGIAMWVAAFDHSQTRHTRHMRPIMLEVE